jgi:hypothetical protein
MLLIEHIQAFKGFFTMQKHPSIEKNGESIHPLKRMERVRSYLSQFGEENFIHAKPNCTAKES